MKINIKNPRHIGSLTFSGGLACVAAITRPITRLFRANKNDKIIIFYGHTLNGNLKAFYDYLLKKKGYKPYFLVLDGSYYKRLKIGTDNPKTILYALNPLHMAIVSKSDAFVTSHGLHFFYVLRKFTNIKFADVWHAVSYKGFDYDNFRRLRPHDEVWVSSQDMEKLYTTKFGFRPEQVKVTGYGRTDQLVNNTLDKTNIIKKYSIPRAKKYVLIAPTWKQDDNNRSVLPFGLSEDEFFPRIDSIAKKHDALIIFRTHLNSGDGLDMPGLSNTVFMPYARYEIVEDFLWISDVLVGDWSSVAIDYLPLKRPTIHLDVPAPFKKGFNLGPEHRFGDIVKNIQELIDTLDSNLSDPSAFIDRHSKQMKITTKVAYGNTLDGKSTERYFDRLSKLLQA